jgi:hypothetical protein
VSLAIHRAGFGLYSGQLYNRVSRIFDTDKRTHSVGRLLQLAETNVSIFSKAAVRRRKNKDLANANHLIDEFMSSVHDPTPSDFKWLRSFVDARRKVLCDTPLVNR